MNILVYADVDMNLTDGSSIWLNSLVQVLARDPSNLVEVLLKARVTKDLLLQDLRKLPNVTLTDPYHTFQGFGFQNKNRMVPDDAIHVLGKLLQQKVYHCVIIRGLEVCKKALATLEEPGRIIPYFTGFTDDPDHVSKEEKEELQALVSKARLVFLQTEEMKRTFQKIVGDHTAEIAVLPPMVPDFPEKEPAFRNKNNAVVYVGKFSNDYYLFESLQAFAMIKDEGIRFNIAGDKFHLDLKVPREQLIELMEQTRGVNWAKALGREEVSDFIEDSDLGLCWRSETIDNERSMELSTKLLEYGRLGKPVLVRRIPIHERLLGMDYPFYVDSAEDLVKKIRLAFTDPVLYEKAARKTYQVSLDHSFSRISEAIIPYLDIFRDGGEPKINPVTERPSGGNFWDQLKRRIFG
jgi:glycosyltransferase involved in cell wall biosynthesis